MESIAHGAPVATTVLVSLKEAPAGTFTTPYPGYYSLPVYYMVTSRNSLPTDMLRGCVSWTS